jgi:lysophospholipase L1-like esterase
MPTASEGTSEVRSVIALLRLSFLVTTLLGVAVAVRGGRGQAFLAASTVATVGCGPAVRWLHRRGFPLAWLLGVAAVNLTLLVPELALRAAGVRFESGIQFGYPRPGDLLELEIDDKLFWRLPRSTAGVNSLGFQGREPAVPKPAGTRRVLFLGDSVAQQGYPGMAELRLNVRRPPGPRFDCVTLAMAGYSSYQGRVLADLYGRRLDPDLVVVCFGWNDHWLAYGVPDDQRSARGIPAAPGGWLRQANRFRLFQALTRAAGVLRGERDGPLEEVRVPADTYRENLTWIRDRFRSAGVPLVFLTAPTSHYRMGVPEYLWERGFVRDAEAAMRLHRQYNGIVREVSRSEGVDLLDLEGEMDAAQRDDLRALFMGDGIHLSPSGLAVVAGRVADLIEKRWGE